MDGALANDRINDLTCEFVSGNARADAVLVSMDGKAGAAQGDLRDVPESGGG